MPTHSLTMTRPGDMTGYQAVCRCGWQGRTHQPDHACTPGEGDIVCTDIDGWRAAHEAAEQAATEEGSDHMADLS